MYTPPHNREDDRESIVAFMRAHSFATLVTARDGITATHLPFLVRDGGRVLAAHMARANPQWRDLGAGEALVIFQGPHAFVSPGHYERELSVPTWNYVAVHAYGAARILDGEGSLALLAELNAAHDPEYAGRFASLPAEFVAAKLKGIVAFELEVARLEARFKLSQDRTPAERDRIVEALSNSADSSERELARLMAERSTNEHE